MKLFLIAVGIIILQNYVINGSVYEYQLISDLFQNYSSKARPSINHSEPTTVYIAAALSQIINVDDRNQVITAYIWLTLYWFDPMLAWNPLNYNNLTDIVVPALDVWKPDISMNQPAEKVIINNDYENVRINYQGVVSWFPNGAYKLYCEINSEYFPFDEQNCSFIFLSQSMSIYQLNLVIYSNLIMNFYLNNTEWDFVNTTSIKHITYDSPFPLQDVTFSFLIRRKPLYHILSFLLPCIVTLAVSFLAFFVPVDSGEKMSISITCLLSILVLLLVISGILPPTSSSFPLIGLFYSTSIAINSLISLTSVIVLNIHHYGANGRPVPIRVQRVFFSRFGKIVMFPKNSHFDTIRSNVTQFDTENSVISFENNNNEIVKTKKNACTNCSQSIKDFFSKAFRSNKIASAESIEVDEIDKDQAQLQWTLLADIVERLLFYIFLFVTIFTLLGIVNIAPNAKIFTN